MLRRMSSVFEINDSIMKLTEKIVKTTGGSQCRYGQQ